MARIFDAIYLGNPGIEIDVTEGNTTNDQVADLLGSSFGSLENPLFRNIQSLSPFGNVGATYDVNNAALNDRFRFDGTTYTTDGVGIYNATLTYMDGTTATVTAKVIQATSGDLFLVPELANDPATLAILGAAPIRAISFDSLGVQGSGLTVDRPASAFDDGVTGNIANNTYTPGNTDSDGTPVTAGNDVIDGREGNDFLNGGGGNDTIYGDIGNDAIFGDTGDDVLFGEDGNDFIDGQDGNDSIFGGLGDDNLRGGAGNDLIDGGDGGEYIEGGVGDDTIFGGGGGDDIRAGAGNDLIDGGDGDEYIDASTGDDTIFGGAGNDDIRAGDGNDVVDGGDGNEYIEGALGDDILAGGAGNDDIRGGDGNDLIDGGLGDEYIEGGAGDDSIFGADGNDNMRGGDGNDVIDGGAGDEYIEGNLGDDVLAGGAGTDDLRGGDGNDDLDGGDGDDYLEAGQGDDVVFGGAGNDDLRGNDGDDLLIGDDGDDQLWGNAGNDIMIGGAGSDNFLYDVGDGLDTVSDFNANPGDNDTVALAGFYDNIGQLRGDFADDGIFNQSNAGDTVWGQVVDYTDNLQILSGEGLVVTGPGLSQASFTVENTNVVCFDEGTLISTPAGVVPIEELRVGDMVQTRDNGPQRLLWVGARRLGAAELAANPHLRPVLLQAGYFGLARDLVVSPQHGILLHHDTRGGSETFYRAKHLAQLPGGGARVMQGKRRVRYFHLLFEEHQVVFANGMACESLYPGPQGYGALSPAARAELATLFPDLGRVDVRFAYGQTARSYAKRRDLPQHLQQLRCA